MTSWVPVQLKGAILNDLVMEQANQDLSLIEELQQIFRSNDPSQSNLAHMLMAQRQFNLTGLLERLDSSTMLAGVEGRTPYADIKVTEFADRMPVGYHFNMDASGSMLCSKQLLRRAFAKQVPAHVMNRAKASFPLPFQSWMGEQGQNLLQSSISRDIFQADAMAQVAAQPANQWAAAWPMFNLNIWLESMWGSQARRRAA